MSKTDREQFIQSVLDEVYSDLPNLEDLTPQEFSRLIPEVQGRLIAELCLSMEREGEDLHPVCKKMVSDKNYVGLAQTFGEYKQRVNRETVEEWHGEEVRRRTPDFYFVDGVRQTKEEMVEAELSNITRLYQALGVLP